MHRMHVCMHVCNACLHVCTYAFMYACMHACVCMYVCMHVFMHACVHVKYRITISSMLVHARRFIRRRCTPHCIRLGTVDAFVTIVSRCYRRQWHNRHFRPQRSKGIRRASSRESSSRLSTLSRKRQRHEYRNLYIY